MYLVHMVFLQVQPQWLPKMNSRTGYGVLPTTASEQSKGKAVAPLCRATGGRWRQTRPCTRAPLPAPRPRGSARPEIPAACGLAPAPPHHTVSLAEARDLTGCVRCGSCLNEEGRLVRSSWSVSVVSQTIGSQLQCMAYIKHNTEQNNSQTGPSSTRLGARTYMCLNRGEVPARLVQWHPIHSNPPAPGSLASCFLCIDQLQLLPLFSFLLHSDLTGMPG